jgi:preprotein translocase subunit SecG
MNNLYSGVLIAHTLIALLIIILVLLQRGKGADAGAAFGAGASGTVFGARGSTNFFSRATAVLATAFFASSLTLAYLSSQQSGAPTSLIEDAVPIEATDQAAGDEGDTEDDILPELPQLEPVGEGTAGGEDEMPSLEAEQGNGGEEAEDPDQQ